MKRRTFTLLELMTVVASISVLAALLLPGVNRSLARAKQTCCSSNLRQLHGAFALYAEEHGDRMPPYVANSTYLHGGTNWAWYTFGYHRDVRLLDCPSSIQGAPEATREGLHLYDGNYGWNYDGTQANRGPVHSHITAPSQAYLIFDSGDQCVIYGGNTWENLMEELDLDFDSGAEGCNRHAGRTTVGYIDGHVGPLTLEAFLAAPNESDKAPWHIKWQDGTLQPGVIPFPSR